MEIWSSGSDDEEMMRPTHGAMFARDAKLTGRCLMAKSNDSDSSNYQTDSMSSGSSHHSSEASQTSTCLNTKHVRVSSSEQVVEKVRTILKAKSISPLIYDPLLNKLLDNISSLGSSVTWNVNKVEDFVTSQKLQ